MHVVFFGDQHVDSAGGAQVSARLQGGFLQAAGHTVTVVSPAMPGHVFSDPGYVDTPSLAITPDREYSLSWPGKRTDAYIDAAMTARPPVDLVHVQADFWGAFTGYRFARRHGLPVVHTMHNRVEVGLRAITPFAPAALWALDTWRRAMLPPLGPAARRGSDGWAYLATLAAEAAAVTAPSAHFARRLEQHGVFEHVDVVWNGIDDAVLDAALAAEPATRAPGLPRLAWVGRMSPEKRLLPFLEAVAESGIRAEVEVIGGGGELAAARRLVDRRRPAAHVTFTGRLPYADTIERIAAADAVVQTSIGFETQGMTPFEAASLGTPAIISDPDVASELGSGFWQVDGSSTSALARVLRRATADIAAGGPVAVNPTIAQRFRQSSRTQAMLAVYQRVLAGRAG